MPFPLIRRENGKKHNGKHCKNNGKQRCSCLRESLVCTGRPCQTDDLRVDGVITKQSGCRHGTKACNKRHNRKRKQRRDQRREDNLPQHLQRFGPHIACSFYRVVVNAAYCVTKEEHVIAGAGKRHGEKDRIEAAEPAVVHIGESVFERCSQNAVAGIKKHIPGNQCNAAVDHCGHISQAENFCPFDIKILRQKHNGNANHIHRNNQKHC